MNLGTIVTQLKKNCPTLSHRVGGAAEHEVAAENGYLTVPAAYVIPLADDASDNRDQTQLFQEVTESIGVILVLDNTADRRGQASSISVEAMKYAVHRALLNFRADETRAPRGLQYEGSSLVKIDGARLVWQMVYSHIAWISEDDGFTLPSEPLLHIDGHNVGDDGNTLWSFDTDLPQLAGTYFDEAEFLALITASVTQNFSGLAPPGGSQDISAQTIGGVTYGTAGDGIAVADPGYDPAYNFGTGPVVALVVDSGPVTLSFAAARFMAFRVGTFVDGGAITQMTFGDNDPVLIDTSPAAPGLQFLGFISDTPFTTVTFTQYDSYGVILDNILLPA